MALPIFIECGIERPVQTIFYRPVNSNRGIENTGLGRTTGDVEAPFVAGVPVYRPLRFDQDQRAPSMPTLLWINIVKEFRVKYRCAPAAFDPSMIFGEAFVLVMSMNIAKVVGLRFFE